MNVQLTKVHILILLVFLLLTLECYETLKKAVRDRENPATIIQEITLWYVCQIFKSMKLSSMGG